MASELQTIADSLGNRLKRAVAIDDTRLRLQAYTSHHGAVDPVRLASILHREAPDDAKRWVLSLKIADAVGTMRVPPNETLNMEARVVAPIRYQETLLGYLWLVDADQTLTDEDLDVVASAAESAGVVMFRETLMRELERGRERELLRDLVSNEPGVRAHAADQLFDARLFVAATPVAALVVRPWHPTEEADESVRVAIGVALEHIRSNISPRHGLQLVRPDHGLIVVATKDPALRAEGLTGLAEVVKAQLEKGLRDRPAWRVIVGISDTQDGLVDTWRAYTHALHAARVALIVRSFGPVVEWQRLGIYRMLSNFPVEQLASEALHPGLLRLFEHRDAHPLVYTLEHYLDRGCDAKLTASELCLHRASLYYRLHKIESISDANLRDGEDRLALHLGLKLARLAGIHPLIPVDEVPAEPQPEPESAEQPEPKPQRTARPKAAKSNGSRSGSRTTRKTSGRPARRAPAATGGRRPRR